MDGRGAPSQGHIHLRYDTADRQSFAIGSTLFCGIISLYLLYQAVSYFGYPLLPPQEIVWNAIVYMLPQQFVLDRARRQELMANGMVSQMHTAKSEALRGILGLGTISVLQSPSTDRFVRRTSIFTKSHQHVCDVPPGLGNWDNSCYQNSILQGLASLGSMRLYLSESRGAENSTSENLLQTISRLTDSANNGRQLWTPAKLKSMSSWQQQDAQEYFSKIMDELDKEATKAWRAETKPSGLEVIDDLESSGMEAPKASPDSDDTVQRGPDALHNTALRNPVDGLLAQKVTCTRCGFSEGLSMIPFNCLTVPIGTDKTYDLEQCLDEYTKLEEISDVECVKCTLKRAEQQLYQMLPEPPISSLGAATPIVSPKMLSLPPELRRQAFRRLSAIQTALNEDDFDDKTLQEKCQIPKKARFSSTKTRQAVIGRAPQTLVVHINRSVFDEMTGTQRKNHASVRYPALLDLRDWSLKSGAEDDSSSLSDKRLTTERIPYRLKAVITHYGRHENGHYICYRQHAVPSRAEFDDNASKSKPDDKIAESSEKRWWRLSDEDVSPISEQDVLAQGGVFMLFYEREEASQELPPREGAEDAVVPEPTSSVVHADAVAEMRDEAEIIQVSGRSPPDLESPVQKQIEIPCLAAETGPAKSFTATGLDSSKDKRIAPSTASDTVELELEAQRPPQPPAPPSPTPPLMRTARGRHASKGSMSDKGFGGVTFRAVAAT